MHEALCRPTDTTLDVLHVERRAADHSANMGSRLTCAVMKHALELVSVLSVAIGCVVCFALVALEWWKSQP